MKEEFNLFLVPSANENEKKEAFSKLKDNLEIIKRVQNEIFGTEANLTKSVENAKNETGKEVSQEIQESTKNETAKKNLEEGEEEAEKDKEKTSESLDKIKSLEKNCS